MNWAPSIIFGLASLTITTGPMMDRAPARSVVDLKPQTAVRHTQAVAAPGMSGATLRLTRSANGLFHVIGLVEGIDVRFVVDTGANVTVLGAGDAARIAWRKNQIAGQSLLGTASGNVPMSWVKIDRIQVAGHIVTSVNAAVPSQGGRVSLLGQDVLSQLRSVTQRGDTLIIE